MTGIGITITFWIMAAAAVVLSIAAISARHPLRSAFFLVGVFFVTAGLFLILEARLLAVLHEAARSRGSLTRILLPAKEGLALLQKSPLPFLEILAGER